MLQTINRAMEKILPLITPASVLLGVFLASHLSSYTYLSPWIFAFMTFSGSIGSSFKEFMKIVSQPFPLIITLFILHIFMPLMAMGAGHLAFSADSFTITGLILGATIPTGITSFVWVAIYRGNTVLTLSIILVDTLLSPFIVPYTLSLLVGTTIHMDAWAMMKGLCLMIVLPSLVGMALNQWTKGTIKDRWGYKLAPFSKIGMAIVIAINSSVIAPYLRNINGKLIALAGLVLGIASLGYIMGWVSGRLFGWKKDIIVALTFNGGMRNISAGAVLAVAYFPSPVAIPVVLGMLFQQSLASLFGYLLHRKEKPTMEVASG